MASSRVTRGSILRLTGLPLMLRVMGTGPGPETPAAAGDASAGRSSSPVPAAPMPIPPRNPRRLNLVFFELTRHLPFVRCSYECGQLGIEVNYIKKSGASVTECGQRHWGGSHPNRGRGSERRPER